MHNAVGGFGPAFEALEVFQVTFQRCAARCGDDGGIGVITREANHGVAVLKEFFHGGLADETCGAGDEDAHRWLLGSVQAVLLY